jgi:hypothetical protein
MAYVTRRDRTDAEPETAGRETLYQAPELAEVRRAPTLEEARDLRRSNRVFVGGTTVEAIGGLAGVILAIVGLASIWSYTMAGLAAIAIGIGLVAHGGAIMTRWNQALSRLSRGRYDRNEIAGGLGTEVFGGLAGIVLGVLAVVNVNPFVTLPIAAIVFGAALLLGGATQPELENLAPEDDPRLRRFTHRAIEASGGVMVMVGIAAAVLGILALVHAGTVVTLSLVAMLCVGAALFLAGGTLGARLVRRFA